MRRESRLALGGKITDISLNKQRSLERPRPPSDGNDDSDNEETMTTFEKQQMKAQRSSQMAGPYTRASKLHMDPEHDTLISRDSPKNPEQSARERRRAESAIIGRQIRESMMREQQARASLVAILGPNAAASLNPAPRPKVVPTESVVLDPNRTRQSLFFEKVENTHSEKGFVEQLKQLESEGRAQGVMNTLAKAFGGPKTFGFGQNIDSKQILAEAEADVKYKNLRRNSRILIQFGPNKETVLPRYVIHPETPWRGVWDLFMMLLVVYFAIVTPINIAFDASPFDIFQLELVFNCFFVLDIVLQFFTTFKYASGPMAGRFETNHKIIIKNYLKLWFWIDILASFPVDLIVTLATGESSGASLNRLLRLTRGVKLMRILRMSRIWQRLLNKTKINPSVVRLFKLFGFLLVEWHWIGCAYWAIAVQQGFTDDLEVSVDKHERLSRLSVSWTPLQSSLSLPFASQYSRAYYWAVMVTTGVGKDIIPTTDTQYLFTVSAIIVGVLMYALIVGSVGSALQSIDTLDGQRRRRLQGIREYLRQRDVSEDLTERVMSYYEYCYTRHLTEFDTVLLKDMHSALQEELDLEINQQLLHKVPKFKQLDDQLLLLLIHSLMSRIYLPNELVYLLGERIHEMYFVVRGDLEELDQTTGNVIDYHSDGAFFGEDLFDPAARRTSTLRCISHCELLVLTKTTLKRIMKAFPEFAVTIQQWSSKAADNKQHWTSYWDKLRNAVMVTKSMRIMSGCNIPFDMVYKGMNGLDVKDELEEWQAQNTVQGSRTLTNIRVDGDTKTKSRSKRQMSYSAFRNQYADIFLATRAGKATVSSETTTDKQSQNDKEQGEPSMYSSSDNQNLKKNLISPSDSNAEHEKHMQMMEPFLRRLHSNLHEGDEEEEDSQSVGRKQTLQDEMEEKQKTEQLPQEDGDETSDMEIKLDQNRSEDGDTAPVPPYV